MFHSKKLIALCTSRIYDQKIFQFIKVLNEGLRKENCCLLVYALNSDIYWDEDANVVEAAVFDIMPFEILDGIIIMDEKIKSHTVSSRIITHAKNYMVPVVVVDGHYDDVPCINFDYKKGFELIVRHLFEEHHIKKPHMMAGLRNNEFSDERIEVFKKLCKEFDVPFDDSMVSYGDFWAVPCIHAMKEFLSKKIPFDAVICANDIMAINVCDLLEKEGFRVPEDVVVSGFDGSEEIYFTSPMISTSSCNITLLAEATANCIIQMFEGKELTNTSISPELIPNESCGCPACTRQSQTMLSMFNNNFYRHQDDIRDLYNSSSDMHLSRSDIEMIMKVYHYRTNNLLCVVPKKCFDYSKNYFLSTDTDAWNKDLQLIFDSDNPPDEETGFVMKKYPEQCLSRMLGIADSGYPIIYNVMDYMNKPLGFVIYHFDQFVLTDYARTAGITHALSMGIGGYINNAYQRELLHKMDEMYKRDALTGLLNRVAFQNSFREIRFNPKNAGKPITVIMSDLDGLKYINDNFGHADGDNAIKAVADALKKACPDHALCARFGGDEVFAVIVGECDAQGIVKNISRFLDEYNNNSGLTYFTKASSGAYTTVLNNEFDIRHALKIADEKMYEVKKEKKYSHS